MIYIMSSPMGDFEAYKKIKSKLSFNEKDSLFILGNVIGGNGSMQILKDMMFSGNIFPVLGKNEYATLKLFPQFETAESTEECASKVKDDDKALFAYFIKHGGLPFLGEFLASSSQDKEGILDYLSEFAAFDTVEAGGRSFVLTFGGINNFEADKDLEDYAQEDFVLSKADYEKIYFKKSFLVSSAVPTYKIKGAKPGRVFTGKKHLALNCNLPNETRLAAVCLDNIKVYYC